MECISANKGVDAQMSLQDKLKVYAGEMHTLLKLYLYCHTVVFCTIKGKKLNN